MNIALLPLGGMGANCYILSSGNEAAVVDPGEDCDALRSFAETTKLNIKYILLTHGHFDHIGGAAFMKETFPDAKVCIGKEDAAMLESSSASLGALFGFDHPPVSAQITLSDGDELIMGGETIRVMHTPGHTPGGVIYLVGDMALCGDTVFMGSIGRCDFPGSSVKQMGESLERVKALPPATRLFPGHGPATDIERELKFNPYLGRNYDTLFD